MALTLGPPPSPTDPAPSWAPGAGPAAPTATPPAQVAVFLAMSLAIALVCAAVDQPQYTVLGLGALATGVVLGLGTPASRLVRSLPGVLAALTAMVVTVVLLALTAGTGLDGIVPPVIIPLVGLAVLGLDWQQVGRLRATTFASGPFVVAAVSVEQGWALPAAVAWLVVAIVALWLLQNDERRGTVRPAPLHRGAPGADEEPPASLDLLRTLGLALLIGLAGAFLLGRPSCSAPDETPTPSQLPDLPYDRLPNGDPSAGGQRPAQPGEVPPEYRGDADGPTPDGGQGPTGAGESEIQVDEDGNRYLENPDTGARYSVNEEDGRSVIRDEDGRVVGEIDDDGVVARDGAGTEQRYRTDGDGRLFLEGADGERYYLEDGGDGTVVLRDEDGDVVASQDPGDPDDHLVIRDPDGDVVVPDPNGDGEIPIPNGGVREGLPGWGGDTGYTTDRDGSVVATDRDGEVRTYDRDWVGRERVRVERPGEPARVFVYDETGPYLTVIEYDEDGRFVKRYRYDPAGVIVDTEPRGEDRTYAEGEGPTDRSEQSEDPDGSTGSSSGSGESEAPAADDDRSATPWLVGGLAVVLLGGLAAWLLSRRRSEASPTERSLAEALVIRIEEHGAAHGRPRRRAETIVAYTRSLAAGPIPDPRLEAIGSLLSQALFGGAPPPIDDLARADSVVSEIVEAHPPPTRADRRHAASASGAGHKET